MCGITGKISLSSAEIRENDIQLMNASLKHRGPDDGGVYISSDRKVGLGHQRLSIIDLSARGHQPMRYMNRYVIVFNGEIYNFQAERKKLEDRGYSFFSNTDTEVIAALYDCYKEDCLSHLRGMFAFAIYDEHEKTLFCARDRVGKKPFKYFFGNGVFIFSSELKAILTQREYQKKPDFLAIHHYLSLQYVPAPLTGFDGIKKLEAGHYLKLDLNTQRMIIKRYWQLDFTKKLNLSESEWREKIISKFDEAVRLRMIADVPLGAFLSGGIDSSAVVAMMAQNSTLPVKTFSIGFKEEKYNELPYARMVARKFKTDHTEFIVEPNALDILPKLVKQYEEPYADSSALPTYYLSEMTRQHVTVALNGDGGDENFAGYPWYSVQKFAAWYQHLLPVHNLFAKPFASFVNRIYPNTFTDRALRFARTLEQPAAYRYLNYICYFTNTQKSELYTDALTHFLDSNDTQALLAQRFTETSTASAVDQAQYVDIHTYLADDLLPKVDLATMSVSLEARSPFLDHEFMELAASIPAGLKLHGFNNKKYILKKALEPVLPHEVMYRPKKGFSVPIEHWFRQDFGKYLESTILSGQATARGLFHPEAIKRLVDVHRTTKTNHAPRLWALLTLELWFREYFD